jgi:hypothetical protein
MGQDPSPTVYEGGRYNGDRGYVYAGRPTDRPDRWATAPTTLPASQPTTGSNVYNNAAANQKAVQDLGIPTNINPRQSLHVNPSDGRSPLTVNAQDLLDGLHMGDYSILRQTRPNSVVVDFGKPIGEFWQNGTAVGQTQYGTVHFGTKGTHIVPANPIQW